MEQMRIYPAQHSFAIGRRYRGWHIAVIAVLHLALFWAVTQPVHNSIAPDQRVWIQLLQPQPDNDTPPVTPAPPRPPAVAARTPDPSPSRTAPLPAPPATVADKPEAEITPLETVSTPASAGPGLAQQALAAVGAIDRQLRAEHPQEFTAPPDTPQTRLAKGFAEAHAAVKPKWHEAARIELWSAPNDPKRIYRVITATGEYCIYLPDKGSMTLNLSARSGYAGFGEGTAAPCPIRF